MSGAHPTIDVWQRNGHEGSYTAALLDYQLTVHWTPERNGARGSFRWTAARDGDKTQEADEAFEEIEAAMAAAERFARERAEATTAAIAEKTKDAG